MNNPKTEDVAEALRRCSLWKRGDCQSCPMKDVKRDEQNGVVFCAGNLMLFAADRLEELEAELAAVKEKQRWIPVTERLTGEYKEVLIMKTNGGDCVNVYNNVATHWMPLPEPPKE